MLHTRNKCNKQKNSTQESPHIGAYPCPLLALTYWGRQGWGWWEFWRASTSSSSSPLQTPRELATWGKFWLLDQLSFQLLPHITFQQIHPVSHPVSNLMIDCDLKLVWQRWTVDSLHWRPMFYFTLCLPCQWLLPVYSLLTSNFTVMYTTNGKK